MSRSESVDFNEGDLGSIRSVIRIIDSELGHKWSRRELGLFTQELVKAKNLLLDVLKNYERREQERTQEREIENELGKGLS